MKKKEPVIDIIMRLFDKYPHLAKEENMNDLVWCIWVERGEIDGYKISHHDMSAATKITTIARERRRAFDLHPPYKVVN